VKDVGSLEKRLSARDLLVSHCLRCEEGPLVWRYNYGIECFIAFCCRTQYKAQPLHEFTRYHVTWRPVDMTNVHLLCEVDLS
jgi:hypothetical protein